MVPEDYISHPMGLGLYNNGVEAADKRFMVLPIHIDGHLVRSLFVMFASKEPERYAALNAAGFPALDCRDKSQCLLHNTIERSGGHYIDVGGTKLIAEGKVGVKARTEPTAYTATGLRFADGTTIDADAIVWCTDFADSNVHQNATQILGGKSMNDSSANGETKSLIGARDIAERMDGTWGIDAEGEIRGMWKRHQNLDNFWVTGGHTQFQRWHSRTLALQIKAALAGILPPAYRDTPKPRTG
jgi:hypothetical protein